MTDEEAAKRIINIRHGVRAMITHALADDMPACATIVKQLSQRPDVAADALMELGEALDVALHGYAAGSGRTVNDVWQVLCANLAEGDAQVAASYFKP